MLASVIVLVLGWAGTLRPVEDGASSVVVPVQYTMERLMQGINSIIEIPHDLQSMRAENAQLKDQVDQLIYQVSMLREIQIENDNLRQLLNLKEQSPDILGPNADLLFADVIGRDPSNLLRYLTIDRGSQDGIKPGMPVITPRGLVGQIDEVRPNSAKVKLLTDPSSSVTAMVQRSRATGSVQGQTGNSLVMNLLPQTEQGVAQVGDLILTSGLGGSFPRHLLIGQVTEVRQRDVDMFQEVQVQPAVDYDQLETVIVVRYFTPIGVEETPTPGVSP